MLAAGDIIAHPPVWEHARADNGGKGFKFLPVFEGVSQTIGAADLALCHLETPVAPAGVPPRTTYQATLDRIAGHLRLRGAAAGGLVVVGAPKAG